MKKILLSSFICGLLSTIAIQAANEGNPGKVKTLINEFEKKSGMSPSAAKVLPDIKPWNIKMNEFEQWHKNIVAEIYKEHDKLEEKDFKKSVELEKEYDSAVGNIRADLGADPIYLQIFTMFKDQQYDALIKWFTENKFDVNALHPTSLHRLYIAYIEHGAPEQAEALVDVYAQRAEAFSKVYRRHYKSLFTKWGLSVHILD